METKPVTILRPLPPTGSAAKPFHQLDWLMEHYLAQYVNPKTRKSFVDGLNTYYKRSLMQADAAVSNRRPFALSTDLHSLSVYDYFHWLKEKGLAPFTSVITFWKNRFGMSLIRIWWQSIVICKNFVPTQSRTLHHRISRSSVAIA